MIRISGYVCFGGGSSTFPVTQASCMEVVKWKADVQRKKDLEPDDPRVQVVYGQVSANYG